MLSNCNENGTNIRNSSANRTHKRCSRHLAKFLTKLVCFIDYEIIVVHVCGKMEEMFHLRKLEPMVDKVRHRNH